MPLSTLDFPPLDLPFDPNSSSDNFTSHPAVISAVNRIVAAAGQMSATVQIPFLTFCDAGMGLMFSLSLLEASHMVEILREASPDGLHVEIIAEKNSVDKNKLGDHNREFAVIAYMYEEQSSMTNMCIRAVGTCSDWSGS
ncbi:hypothetical protein F5877DRAFT_73570 [Lentinula edodes]|nr:hypothetical protein F5877DRAFT_73570 [Lentinula edodes]